ncbi:hypothetical protein MTO96_031430 [Rhipicephalus appendiculatus]
MNLVLLRKRNVGRDLVGRKVRSLDGVEIRGMAELQVTLEFFVELFKFSNVDLFQRGYYQIRTALKVPQRLPARVEVQLPKSTVIQSYALPIVFPPCVVNGTAVHALVDAHKVRDMLSKADFQLSVELWFTDQNFWASVGLFAFARLMSCWFC